MKRYSNKAIPMLIWILIWLVVTYGAGFVESLGASQTELQNDPNMRTDYFNTDIVVREDRAYEVTEHIGVDFLESRHGIYRHIPYKGLVYTAAKDGGSKAVPYYAKVTNIKVSDGYTTDSTNGSKVLKIGSENSYLYGPKEYQISYTFTPKVQEKGYNDAVYNVLPGQWQNPIPEGSRFSVTFPKEFNRNDLRFYYGSYGEDRDAREVLKISWSGNTMTGILKSDLKLGEGITFRVPMQAGYFTNDGRLDFLTWLLLVPGVVIFLLILLLFFLFGKDEQMIPSIQYQPPEGLDSAAVGYIIDGKAQDKDMLSLIIYWADKGYLRIEELADHELCLYKLNSLPPNSPNYQHTIFNKLFEKGDERKIKDLQYKFAGTLDVAKTQLKDFFHTQGKDMLYTRSSKISRWISTGLCTLPMVWFIIVTGIYTYTTLVRGVVQLLLWGVLLIGALVFCINIDDWYAKGAASRKGTAAVTLGVCFLSMAVYTGSYVVRVRQREIFDFTWILVLLLLMTGAMVVMAGFMKRRTTKCIEWMGRIAGLRDFIETAELERMNELGKTDPQWFYHIIPYAYVFGLSDVFAEKLKSLALPAPQWYAPYHSYTFFDYYMFNRLMVSGLNKTASTLAVTRPSGSVSTGSGGFSGGSFGGGGGFSGGGFGGGGGGSW
ncbi:MAG: DUF2207 domain-containing protein [Faecalicatena sp.]|uniref:DUF2207 domain-containing protein n=1 Tax=Faecalicatena sp. TaxID=2005360 RepID=UPI002589687E|nr:DUF2207 domain-containing protein [Faecalicatena sp.]MCI6466853.1 DUF2207 domain-containing protein [Faecalicatena sp.]MDY5619673.1 DUF2207 domain-containing protein [Lachnospiraceae bacterium]